MRRLPTPAPTPREPTPIYIAPTPSTRAPTPAPTTTRFIPDRVLGASSSDDGGVHPLVWVVVGLVVYCVLMAIVYLIWRKVKN